MPSLSVIIPAYKARKFLPDCLDSIGIQTLQPSEVLVIDDASPEPIDDIVAEFANREGYPPIRLIKHETNRGQAAGRNTGIHASSGELLAFIDCDDIWAPGHLQQAVDTLEDQRLDLVFCPATLFEHSVESPMGFVEQPMNEAEGRMEPLALLKRCFIIMSSVVAKAEIIRDLGGFDESPSMRAVEDLDLFLKLLEQGKRFGMGAQSTLFYRKHPDAATARTGHMTYQAAVVREKHAPTISGNWFRKRSIVAFYWWKAWLDYLYIGEKRWGVLARALWQSVPVPQEILRGIIRTYRIVVARS
jgi:glycosyltransferase involved in cell wall biosynthesis